MVLRGSVMLAGLGGEGEAVFEEEGFYDRDGHVWEDAALLGFVGPESLLEWFKEGIVG
jgi:hypothetical protein